MYKSFVLLFVLTGASLGQKEGILHPAEAICPTWTFYDPSIDSCKCGWDIHQIVFCVPVDGCPKTFEVSVRFGFCMTLNENQTKEVVGSCPFGLKTFSNQRLQYTVPNNTSELDRVVCRYTNRTGQLCGQCVNGTSPPVYSYYPQCVNC